MHQSLNEKSGIMFPKQQNHFLFSTYIKMSLWNEFLIDRWSTEQYKVDKRQTVEGDSAKI